MACELLQGKKGSGKSKLAVMHIRDHLLEGRLVATNLDLFLDKLMPPDSKAIVIRIPDKPTVAALEALGSGNNGDRYNPDHNGLLVVDELGDWLNARTFNDPTRMPVISWLIHSRKKGWETTFICQDIIQIDKQVRETQVDYVTRCVVGDKIRMPIIGRLVQALFGKKAGMLPKFHIATRRLGTDRTGLVAGSWWYKDGGVQAGYDTLQEFTADYPHGAHSLLSAWHLVGRYLPAPEPLWRRAWARVFGLPVRPPLRPKLAPIAALAGRPKSEAWSMARQLVASL